MSRQLNNPMTGALIGIGVKKGVDYYTEKIMIEEYQRTGIIRKRKSVGKALLLALFFGGFGLFYSSERIAVFFAGFNLLIFMLFALGSEFTLFAVMALVYLYIP